MEQKRTFEAALDDISSKFKPDLIMISPASIRTKEIRSGSCCSRMKILFVTKAVKQWAADACEGRIVSCLEGGYNLQTLGETVRRHVAELHSSSINFKV